MWKNKRLDLRFPALMNESEAYLLRRLRDAPREHGYRYTQYSAVNLLKDLFHALACNRREYLALLFPNGLPTDDDPDSWKLSAAQGAVEGAEYTSAARGKTCGHIFRAGESTYRCKYATLSHFSDHELTLPEHVLMTIHVYCAPAASKHQITTDTRFM